jgi:hypothetical protein
VAGIIGEGKLFVADVRQNRRGPNPRVAPLSDRPTRDDIVELRPLGGGAFAGAPTAGARFNPRGTGLVPVAEPGRHAGAVDWRQVGEMRRGVPCEAEPAGLAAQRNAGRWVALCRWAQG